MKLQSKIFFLFVSVALLLGGPLLWTVRQTAHQIDMDELRQKGSLAAVNLADRVSGEFQSARETDLLPFLQAAQEQTGALYVAAIDSAGRVLAHTNVTEKGLLYNDAQTLEDLRLKKPDGHLASYKNFKVMKVAAPVWSRNNVVSTEDYLLSGQQEPVQKTRLGVIRLGLPLDQVIERERRLLRRIAEIVLVAGGVGIFLLFFVMRRMLRPVQWLLSGTRRIAKGEYAVTVPVLSKDELGDLADSFNRMSKALSETTVSKNFLGDILSHMIDPLIVVDVSGVLRMVNQATLDLLGYSNSELEGRPARGLFVGSDNAEKNVQAEQMIMAGAVRNQELELFAKSGAKILVLFSSSVLQGADGKTTGVIAVAKDMTERKRLEGIIRQSDKMSAVGQLAAGVAHEINNPLGVILGFSQALVRRLKPDDPLEMPLKSIEKEAVRCRNLVQDLLTFSRASKIDREPVDLNRAVEGAFSLVIAQARMTHVRVNKELAPDLPRILGNLNQIQQIIINLANNALDAMGDLAGQVTIKTEILKDGPLSWVCLKVTDTGPGIPPHILPRIFEPFFTTKPVGKGTGLGLSLVHEIIEKHSGTTDVESRPGHTEFRIKFPVQSVRLSVKSAPGALA